MKNWFYPLGLVSFIGFAIIVVSISKGEVIAIDDKMSHLLAGNTFLTLFHYLGETSFILVVMLLLLGYLWIRSKNYRGMLFVLFSVGIGNVANQLLKKWIQRQRPDIPHQLESFSFPSGHAMVGLLYVFTIAYFFTEHQSNKMVRLFIWIGAILLSLFMGLSRIAESRHYATDVFAGWMVGYTWFILMVLWYEMRKRNFIKKDRL